MADLKVKISEFPLATESKDTDDIAILQDGINKKIKSPILESKILDKADERYVNKNKLGVNNGVATLGSDGKLSESQRFTLDINPSFIPIDLTTPTSEVDGVFLPTTSGVYVNYGGLSIDLDLGSYLITKIGDTYKSILLAVESTLIANDIDDLRSKEPAYEGQIITLLGYYEAGDKEPLNYKWTSEQGIDDGGSVINTETGSWEALFFESIDVRDFGIKNGVQESSDLAKINSIIRNNTSFVISFYNLNIEIDGSRAHGRDNSGIMAVSNSKLQFTNTKIKQVKTDSSNYAIISINNVSNVDIRGEVELIGDRDEHIGEAGEWGYGISIFDSNNVNINRVIAYDMWGDGVNLDGENTSKNVNIKINSIVTYNNRRQGVSISSCDNLTIGSVFAKNIMGTLPMAGIDIEPNIYQRTINIYIGSVYVENANFGLALLSIQNDNVVENVTVNNLTCINVTDSDLLVAGKADLTSVLKNNKVNNMFSKGNGNIVINTFNGVDTLTVSNVFIKDSNNEKIIALENTNNVRIENITVSDSSSERFILAINANTSCIQDVILQDSFVCESRNLITFYGSTSVDLNNIKTGSNRENRFLLAEECSNIKIRESLLNFSDVGQAMIFPSTSNVYIYNNSILADTENIVSCYKTLDGGVPKNINIRDNEISGEYEKVIQRDITQNVNVYDNKIVKSASYEKIADLIVESDYIVDNLGADKIVERVFNPNFSPNYSQNTAFGEASLVKKGKEVFIKMFANKSTNVGVGDTVFTLQPELRPKVPEFIVGHGGNGGMAVWLMIEPTTGAVKVQELPTGGSTTAIVISGSFFIKD